MRSPSTIAHCLWALHPHRIFPRAIVKPLLDISHDLHRDAVHLKPAQMRTHALGGDEADGRDDKVDQTAFHLVSAVPIGL